MWSAAACDVQRGVWWSAWLPRGKHWRRDHCTAVNTTRQKNHHWLPQTSSWWGL